jgi:hypothetical protein
MPDRPVWIMSSARSECRPGSPPRPLAANIRCPASMVRPSSSEALPMQPVAGCTESYGPIRRIIRSASRERDRLRPAARANRMHAWTPPALWCCRHDADKTARPTPVPWLGPAPFPLSAANIRTLGLAGCSLNGHPLRLPDASGQVRAGHLRATAPGGQPTAFDRSRYVVRPACSPARRFNSV